jgi:hypothetical protein
MPHEEAQIIFNESLTAPTQDQKSSSRCESRAVTKAVPLTHTQEQRCTINKEGNADGNYRRSWSIGEASEIRRGVDAAQSDQKHTIQEDRLK